MCQTGDADELFEIARNELRAVVGDDSRFGVWIFSKPRWRLISTSASVMASRSSQCTIAREQPSSSEQR